MLMPGTSPTATPTGTTTGWATTTGTCTTTGTDLVITEGLEVQDYPDPMFRHAGGIQIQLRQEIR